MTIEMKVLASSSYKQRKTTTNSFIFLFLWQQAETLYIAAMDFPVNETIDVGNGQYMRVWEVEVEVSKF